MTDDDLRGGLQGAITSHVPLSQIVTTLREYRDRGVSRRDVQTALESLRSATDDEATEDRILEVMDIVSGFCPRETTVWED